MKVILTLNEVLHKCTDWSLFCQKEGYSEWCVNEGGGSIEITLSESQAIKYGILNKNIQELDIMETTINKLRIDQTDIYLENLGYGKGKIVVSDPYMGAFNFYWGSMGGTIEDFLSKINGDYFADKLCVNTYEFSAKNSVKNVRKYIREEMSWELPWYEYRSAQKEMREEMKKLESCDDKNEFISRMISLPDSLMCFGMDYHEEKEFKSIIEPIFTSEPWNFIGEDVTKEYKWLKNLLTKIKKIL